MLRQDLEYRVFYDEKNKAWVAESLDGEHYGFCPCSPFKSKLSDYAAAVAIMDAADFDRDYVITLLKDAEY